MGWYSFSLNKSKADSIFLHNIERSCESGVVVLHCLPVPGSHLARRTGWESSLQNSIRDHVSAGTFSYIECVSLTFIWTKARQCLETGCCLRWSKRPDSSACVVCRNPDSDCRIIKMGTLDSTVQKSPSLKSIHDLPDEVLIHILWFLDVDGLLAAAKVHC